MTDRQVRVKFEPLGRAVHVLPGTNVLEAAACAGLTVDTPCGGEGACGKCRVRIAQGGGQALDVERQHFTTDEISEGWRLACRTTVREDMAIHVPDSSLFAGRLQILETAMLRGDRPFELEPVDDAGPSFGAAFDVGTTTLVGSLMNLNDGEETAVTARINPQVAFGDDVLSRIRHAGSAPDGLNQLHAAVVTEIGRMIDDLCRKANVRREHIRRIALAGNTTMQHLLCRFDPTPLGESPFTPAQLRSLSLPAQELGIPLHDNGAAYVFPIISGYVGGDIVAGMLATRIASQAGPVLMIDIGTNGEIVLMADGQIHAASTAAGPAFEGARISCGMRAADGAIEKVTIDGDLRCGVIGDGPATGLCGSGLIDLVAELLDSGIVARAGRMIPPDQLPNATPESIRRRVRHDGDGKLEFLLADPPSGASHGPVTLTQADVRELQLAAGAIRAGINVLLKHADLTTADLESVLLAGGFGSFIRRNHAQRIGLLPADVAHRRIHYVGNVSLAGAKWALLSTQARDRAEELARQTCYVELSTDADFNREFAEAMIFPFSSSPEPGIDVA